MLGALKEKSGWCAALTAALLLFAQIATATQACMLAQPNAPQQTMSEAGCDGMPMDAAECAVRCGVQVQAPAPDHSFHADQVAAANFFLPFALPAVREASPWVPRRSAGPAGPPLQILYCTYQF